jgi:thymidylate synthase (FAD)
MARQFVKHQIGLVWNEESRRYISDEPEFYVPEVFRLKPTNAKQGSSSDFPEYVNLGFMQDLRDSTKQALNLYNYLLQEDVAPEQARMVLPQNVMTNWMWTGSLVAFARVCQLRLDSHAQKEAQELAQLINDVVAPLYPVSWSALMNKTVG